jgi:hypothetical protein
MTPEESASVAVPHPLVLSVQLRVMSPPRNPAYGVPGDSEQAWHLSHACFDVPGKVVCKLASQEQRAENLR